MGRILLAALAGALAMFIWGFVAWMVIDLRTPETFKGEGAVAAAINYGAAEPGVYAIPGDPGTKDKESSEYKTFQKNYESGPIAMVIVKKDGAKLFDPLVLLKGYGVMLLACLIVALMISEIGIKLALNRILFCTAIGAVVAIHADGSNWAWFWYPMDWTLMAHVDRVVAWTLAGTAMAPLLSEKRLRRA